jgi:hypothetical protein
VPDHSCRRLGAQFFRQRLDKRLLGMVELQIGSEAEQPEDQADEDQTPDIPPR